MTSGRGELYECRSVSQHCDPQARCLPQTPSAKVVREDQELESDRRGCRDAGEPWVHPPETNPQQQGPRGLFRLALAVACAPPSVQFSVFYSLISTNFISYTLTFFYSLTNFRSDVHTRRPFGSHRPVLLSLLCFVYSCVVLFSYGAHLISELVHAVTAPWFAVVSWSHGCKPLGLPGQDVGSLQCSGSSWGSGVPFLTVGCCARRGSW